MTGPAYDRVIAALEAAGRPVKHLSPARARSSCPGHDGDNPDALSITDGETRVSLHCFTAGCDGADILAAVGLTVADRYHEPKTSYVYEVSGKPVRTVIRDAANKQFRQAGIVVGLAPSLYRLDRLATAKTVYLVEGEEDVHALEAVGIVATTAPMGATTSPKSTPLRYTARGSSRSSTGMCPVRSGRGQFAKRWPGAPNSPSCMPELVKTPAITWLLGLVWPTSTR